MSTFTGYYRKLEKEHMFCMNICSDVVIVATVTFFGGKKTHFTGMTFLIKFMTPKYFKIQFWLRNCYKQFYQWCDPILSIPERDDWCLVEFPLLVLGWRLDLGHVSILAALLLKKKKRNKNHQSAKSWNELKYINCQIKRLMTLHLKTGTNVS